MLFSWLNNIPLNHCWTPGCFCVGVLGCSRTRFCVDVFLFLQFMGVAGSCGSRDCCLCFLLLRLECAPTVSQRRAVLSHGSFTVSSFTPRPRPFVSDVRKVQPHSRGQAQPAVQPTCWPGLFPVWSVLGRPPGPGLSYPARPGAFFLEPGASRACGKRGCFRRSVPGWACGWWQAIGHLPLPCPWGRLGLLLQHGEERANPDGHGTTSPARLAASPLGAAPPSCMAASRSPG